MNFLLAVVWYMLIGVAAAFATGVVSAIIGNKRNGIAATRKMGDEMLEFSESSTANKSMIRVIGGIAVGLLLWPLLLPLWINAIWNVYFKKEDERTE